MRGAEKPERAKEQVSGEVIGLGVKRSVKVSFFVLMMSKRSFYEVSVPCVASWLFFFVLFFCGKS